MTSRDGSEQLPGGTESNAIIQSPTMKAFPDILDDLNSKHHLNADANDSKQNTNHSKAEADGYLQSMTMYGWSRMLHSKDNQSFLLD